MIHRLRLGAIALLALLAVSLGATGMAHRAPSVTEAQLLAYQQLGVTLDDICGMTGMGQGAADCPLCRIDPGFVPPAPRHAAAEWVYLGQGPSLALTLYRVPSRAPVPSQGPRAPPVV